MTDTVFIEGLRLDALIGVHDRERHAPQLLLLDVRMRFDVRVAAVSDTLVDALDYESISQRLTDFAAQTDFMLIETLAEGCATLVLEEFGAKGVWLKLSKPGALPNATAAGVEIQRGSFGE